MRTYAPYLLYQIARFGALTVPQMLRVCDGMCARSSLYRALGELVDGKFVYPILNPATRTRAYYATPDGKESVFGAELTSAAVVRARDLDHTILCAEVLLELGHYENVTGITTEFEICTEEIKRFCFERIPDGIIRLSQNGEHFELAVEVESSVRNSTRISQVLENYWQTFRRGMECYGLLVVAITPTVFQMYTRAISKMPPEFQSRVKLLEGQGLLGIRPEAFGIRLKGRPSCLDLTRTTFLEEVTYSPMKSGLFLAQAHCPQPTQGRARQQSQMENSE